MINYHTKQLNIVFFAYTPLQIFFCRRSATIAVQTILVMALTFK